MYPTLANLFPLVAVAIAPSETPTPKTFLLIQLSGLEEKPLTLGSFMPKAEPNCAILLAPTTATLKANKPLAFDFKADSNSALSSSVGGTPLASIKSSSKFALISRIKWRASNPASYPAEVTPVLTILAILPTFDPIVTPLNLGSTFDIAVVIGFTAAVLASPIAFLRVFSLEAPWVVAESPALAKPTPPTTPPVNPLKTNSEAIIPAVKEAPCKKSSAQKEAVPILSPKPISCSS